LQKNFIINILIIVLINVAIKPIWIFGVDTNVQLALGDTTYGLYAALLNLSLIFNMFLDIGLTNYNTKVIAEDASAIQQNFVHIAVAKLVLFIVYLAVLMGCAVAFGHQYASLHLLLLIACIQFLNSFVTFLRSNISANQFFKTDSIISIIDKVVVIILFAGYYVLQHNLNNFTLYLFLIFQIIGYLFAAIIAIFYTKKITIFSFSTNWHSFYIIIRNSIPYAILILLMGIYIRSDLFLMERLLPNGAEKSGLYAKCFRMLDAFNMIGFLFAGMLLPMFVRQIKEHQSSESLISISTTLLVPASIAVAIFTGVHAKEILQLLYHQSDKNLVQAFMLVMVVFPAMSMMNIFSTFLTAYHKITLLIKIAAVAALISILSNYFVIYYFKNYIAVCAVAVVVQYGVNAAYLYFTMQIVGKSILPQIVYKCIIIAVLFIIVNLALKYFSIDLFWCGLLNIFCYIPILYWFNILRWGIVKQYFGKV
jgi:O-antigen/teichoic acid export membrane protein